MEGWKIMGTNYYKINKMPSEDEIELTRLSNDIENHSPYSDNRARILQLIDELLGKYMVHLGKLSYGWRPVLEIKDEVKDWETFKSNLKSEEKDIIIKNEYGQKYTVDEFTTQFEYHLSEMLRLEKGDTKVDGEYQCKSGMRWTYGDFC